MQIRYVIQLNNENQTIQIEKYFNAEKFANNFISRTPSSATSRVNARYAPVRLKEGYTQF